MTRDEIQKKVSEQWEGTGDNSKVIYAIENARTVGNAETVDKSWRWLAVELSELYFKNPDIGAACHSFIYGWITGASHILSKALLNYLGD